MIVLVIILAVLVLVLSYTTYVNYKKSVRYEEYIELFYSRASIVLASMRAIDSSGMFESDDDVGGIFIQLVDILDELSPLIYGDPDDED